MPGRLLKDEKIPFVLAALLGFWTWTVTRAVDRIEETPIVEYSQTETSGPQGRVVSFQLENISAAELKDVQFVILLEDSKGHFDERTQPSVEPELPLMVDRDHAPEAAKDSATFAFPEIHPGGRFVLRAGISDDAVPGLGIRSPSSPVRLLKPTMRTFLVKHELALLIVLSLAIGALIGVYVFILAKN